VVSNPNWVTPKTMQLVYVASPLNTHPHGERAKTDWLGIRIMYPTGVTCLSVHCCFNELAL
jgi:hypothetical protein